MFIETLQGERFWGGHAAAGIHMPYKSGFSDDLGATTYDNQTNYMLLSNMGRIIWSDSAFKFTVCENGIEIEGRGEIKNEFVGKTLREACIHANKNIYAPKTGIPPKEFFSKPQFNTWIELIYDQNQEDILRYAQTVYDSGYPHGVLMIDDNWQEDYGVWSFHEGRFSDPKAMMDKLHELGFKVMLWVVPFVSPDCATFRMLRKKGAFVKTKDGETYIAHWWNGYSAVLDLSNPVAWDWFRDQMDTLQDEYGVDGFKFHAGGPQYYPEDCVYHKEGMWGDKQTQLFCDFAAQYPYNELRETINQPHLPCCERLCDKAHSWDKQGLNTLAPNSIAQSLMGYQFICPDMIGGGEYGVFFGGNPRLDRELIVRMAQASALLPMMQFSLAPWRVLNEEMNGYCFEAAKLHDRFGDYIYESVVQACESGEPVLQPMEYVYPHKGYIDINDQFMLGKKILVAPIYKKDEYKRTVVLPDGLWRADDGTEYAGGCTVTVDAPLCRLPWFEKL